MKIFISMLLLFILKTSIVLAQGKVIIKGYLITRYDRKEIIKFYGQKIKKMNNESYSITVDFEKHDFFVPLQIGNKIVVKSSSVYPLISKLSNLNQSTLFFVPKSKDYEKYFSDLSGKSINLSNEINLFKDLESSYPYYVDKNDDRYIYKCTYVETEAYEFEIENNSTNRFKLDIDIDAIKKNSNKIKIYFFNHVSRYNPFVEINNFLKWFPYLDKVSVSK